MFQADMVLPMTPFLHLHILGKSLTLKDHLSALVHEKKTTQTKIVNHQTLIQIDLSTRDET